MSILIRGGTVASHDHSRRADVLIDEARIPAVGKNVANSTWRETNRPRAVKRAGTVTP